MIEKLTEKFREVYGDYGDIRCYFAPGRVNLIGEHTDYNGGHVFPCALSIGTYGILRNRKDRSIRFFSVNYEDKGIIEKKLDGLFPSEEEEWTNYPCGVIWAFQHKGYQLEHGFDILIYGDLPVGAGLSSSASLEVLTGFVLKDIFQLSLSMIEVAFICQYSENTFSGCNCGIMDQFTSAMGKKDYAVFLDTYTLEYEYVPIALDNARIVIVNSKVKHSLVDSAYNDRRKDCERALKDLKKVMKIHSLGELSEREFEDHKEAIQDETRRKRVKHAVYENQRTVLAAKALKSGNIKLFGELMNASHVSLRDDYDVSCEEIDLLVELAWNMPGVLGSRITGGGFGGCTVNIVENDAVEDFVSVIGKKYKEITGLEAEFYFADAGDGARRL